MDKEKRTRNELAKMVTDELRKHPKCANVTRADIVPTQRQAPYQPNWNAVWVRNGKPSEQCDEAMQTFVTDLQNKYDLT